MVAAAFLEIFSVERRTHYPGNAHVGPSCQLSNRINVFKEFYPVFVIPSKRQKVETEKNEETQNVLAIRKPMSTGVNFLCIPYIFDESNFVLDAWLSRLFLNT